jgi:membrane-associated phospholipid phosphatase
MNTFAYGTLCIYLIALPFYLFVPITNVYTFYGSTSALSTVIPGVEQFFYTTTTNNNCFPSLHVAMALLVAKTVSLTNNKRYTYVAYLCAFCVICSVIYLAIHWITDVLGGILLAYAVFYLLKRFNKGTLDETQ